VPDPRSTDQNSHIKTALVLQFAGARRALS
jgi:hypothetical protein